MNKQCRLVRSLLIFHIAALLCEYIAGCNMVQPTLNFIKYHVILFQHCNGVSQSKMGGWAGFLVERGGEGVLLMA